MKMVIAFVQPDDEVTTLNGVTMIRSLSGHLELLRRAP